MIGNLLRKAADGADSAASAVANATKGVKDKATGLVGDEKDEVVFDGAIDLVQDALIDASLMTADINTVLKALKEGNPYRE